jgi:hypothetical protein
MATKLHFPSQQSEWTGHRYHKKEFDLGAAWAKHKKLLEEEAERRKDWPKDNYQTINETAINNYHERQLDENT